MTVEKHANSNLVKALTKARTSVRGNVDLIDAEIVDFYETGEDKNDGTLIQPLEVKINGEEEIRRYVLRGEDAIQHILGEPNADGIFPKVTYEGDIPKSVKMPDCVPNKDGVYWYGIKKI